MESSSLYSGILSARSRRLRTVGVVLLAAVCAMALYGYFGLMPSIERSLRENPIAAAGPSSVRSGVPPESANPPLTRGQRIRKFQVAVALAYWGVCALLLVGVLLVAWLDFREVTRVYVEQRRAVWGQAASSLEDISEEEDA